MQARSLSRSKLPKPGFPWHTRRMRVASTPVYLLYDYELRSEARKSKRLIPSAKDLEKELSRKAIVGFSEAAILLREDGVRIEGQYIATREEDGKMWISFRVDGHLESFWPQDVLNEIFEEQQKTESWRRAFHAHVQGAEEEIRRRDILERDYGIQWGFFEQLLEHYHAYGTKCLASFFDEGREIKKKDLKKRLRDIAVLLRNECSGSSAKYSSMPAGAEDYARMYTSFGKEINAASLVQSVKNLNTEEKEKRKEQKGDGKK